MVPCIVNGTEGAGKDKKKGQKRVPALRVSFNSKLTTNQDKV